MQRVAAGLGVRGGSKVVLLERLGLRRRPAGQSGAALLSGVAVEGDVAGVTGDASDY